MGLYDVWGESLMYQALYRKYRNELSQLVGQEVAAKSKQAVEQEEISHAYLFSGPRGTGKTSVARFLPGHELSQSSGRETA